MALTKSEIENFKKRLILMKKQILTSVKGTKEEVQEMDQSKGYSQHQADEGTDDFGRTINLEVSSKEIALVRQIDRALEKIEEGTYGICDISSKEIPKARLEAIPQATMTVDIQDKFEKGLL
jgi:DnaK suppressor protein